MYHLLDILLTLVHLAIILINLFGWMWRQTRELQFWMVVFTAGSWLLLGAWFGWGYCPITDWQWQVKEKLGVTGLPSSFVKYYADKIAGNEIPPHLIDMITVLAFAFSACMAIYYRFFFRGKANRSR